MNRRRELIRGRDEIGTWGRIVKARLETLQQHAGRSILDVGCSSGAYVRALRARGFDAYGCDLLGDPQWRQTQPPAFALADAARLPFFDGAFDTCAAFEVLEHIPDLPAVLAELHRVCRKNIVVSVPNCEQEAAFQESGLAYHHWVDRTHVQQFKADSLRRALEENGFRIRLMRPINPVTPETLALTAWRIPLPLASFIGQAARRMPLRRNYCMTLLAVADKIAPGRAP